MIISFELTPVCDGRTEGQIRYLIAKSSSSIAEHDKKSYVKQLQGAEISVHSDAVYRKRKMCRFY